jgi:U3 small nucleolar RNA-associated protein 11
MSSFKNAINQKTHRERSQPAARSKWGLLEKHKDYIKRAQDYHRKEKALSTLKRKAYLKNPDEFYFGMISAKTTKGVHVLNDRNKTFEPELLKLLKTQDQNYISLKRAINSKKLGSGINLSSEANNNHTIFVDSEMDAKTFDLEKHFNADTDTILQKPWNRLNSNVEIDDDLVQQKQMHENLLKKRQEREKKLDKVLRELEIQRHLMVI